MPHGVIILSDINVDYVYTHKINDKEYILNTREIKDVLGEVPINNMDVIGWIKNNIKEGFEELKS